jgi:hypothetical protein
MPSFTPGPLIAVMLALSVSLGGTYMGAYCAMLEGKAADWKQNRFRPIYRSHVTAVANVLEPAHFVDRCVRPGHWTDPMFEGGCARCSPTDY